MKRIGTEKLFIFMARWLIHFEFYFFKIGFIIDKNKSPAFSVRNNPKIKYFYIGTLRIQIRLGKNQY